MGFSSPVFSLIFFHENEMKFSQVFYFKWFQFWTQNQPPEVLCEKKLFAKILQYSQDNICVGVSFNITKKGLQYRCFPVNIAKFRGTKNTYFEEPLRTAAFVDSKFLLKLVLHKDLNIAWTSKCHKFASSISKGPRKPCQHVDEHLNHIVCQYVGQHVCAVCYRQHVGEEKKHRNMLANIY